MFLCYVDCVWLLLFNGFNLFGVFWYVGLRVLYELLLCLDVDFSWLEKEHPELNLFCEEEAIPDYGDKFEVAVLKEENKADIDLLITIGGDGTLLQGSDMFLENVKL